MNRSIVMGVLLALVAAGCSQPEARSSTPPVPALRMPDRDVVVLVHYELGMHCSGFDLSYCCVLPPFNSILAQVVRTARHAADTPSVLKPDDLRRNDWVLWYDFENNTYSEGTKLLYWNVPYDVNANGVLGEPPDSFANAEWTQLYTYAERPFRAKPNAAREKRVLGRDLPISMDHGLTGKSMSQGTLEWTDDGTVVYSVLNDGASEIGLPIGQRDYWEALGLPLTPFFDGTVPFLRGITEEVIRPYQVARVTLSRFADRNGDGEAEADEVTPVRNKDGSDLRFIGTDPIDMPQCDRCHGGPAANGDEFHLWKKEYDFWKRRFPNTSDYYARTKAAAISMLEIHDKRSGTKLLEHYDPNDVTGAAITRLGRPPVKCQQCHGDNVIGVLDSETSTVAGGARTPIPLSAAIHRRHLLKKPQPDRFGRTAGCQSCHPGHSQSGDMSRLSLGFDGEFRGGANGDVREYWGGCYLGRDVHSNPKVRSQLRTKSHLTAVGDWLRDTVMKDGKGLYCTNCHNLGSRLLYQWDQFEDAFEQSGPVQLIGPSVRNQSLSAIMNTLRGMNQGRYGDLAAEDLFDPKVTPADKDRVSLVWSDRPAEPYGQVDDGWDYWLSAGEPHCADCHKPPFVESIGGTYFPIDQPNRYALMRYSKGHHGISCQGCHQSTHGLFPVDPDGPDPTTYRQATSLNPDRSAGPLTCAVCHVVDRDGIPPQATDLLLAAFPDSEYPTRYEKAVAYAHSQRTAAERYSPSRQLPPAK
ncbi:MAG: hypothetical protein HY292_05995 [Planctomycetes bacterium]|nr:hypothetical protein [Planctomycetota bacterium]